MSKKGRMWLSATTGLAATSLLLASSPAFATHTGGDVVLKDASGNTITNSSTPYSPKATCARACHIANGDAVDFVGHDYGSGTRVNYKTQGVLESDGKLYWQSYNVKGFDHGVIVGKHSNEGLNEDYSMDMRRAFGDPFFTSSAGMFGKF